VCAFAEGRLADDRNIEAGRFKRLRELGRGASARVVLAEDARDGSLVALKIFHPYVFTDEALRDRAKREASIASSLAHPGVVAVKEALLDGEEPMLVMEYLDGEEFSRLQHRLPYTLPELAVRLVAGALDGLAFAHERGIVHRDLKPENIFLCRDGRVVVTDFGLARTLDRATLTRTGHLVGTPDFIAPEVVRGERPTARSDVFAVAATLYFLLTGTKPFRRASPVATLSALQNEAPEAPQRRNPKISNPLSELVLRGLAKNPDERFADAREFRDALLGYLRSVGFDPDEFTPLRWLASPQEFVGEAMEATVAALGARAEKLIGEKDPRATEVLAHLATVAPDSPTLERLLARSRQLAQRDDRRRVLVYVAVPLLVLVTGGGLVWGGLRIARFSPAAPTETAASKAPPSDAAASKSTAAPSAEPVAGEAPEPAVAPVTPPATARPAAPKPPARTAANPAVPQQKTSLSRSKTTNEASAASPVDTARENELGKVIFSIPSDVDVYWDGRLVDSSQMLEDVTPGKHRLRLEREGYDPIETTVRVRPGPPTRVRVGD
jgi:serine/threonine-protein kinase